MAKAKAQAAVEKAQKALAKAQAKHREAFREELVKLFNQYQLKLVPAKGSTVDLEIAQLGAAFQVSELPE